MAGNDVFTGGPGNDVFNVDAGTDSITDLGGSSGGDADILVVSSGSTANVNNIISFIATSDTVNSGTANLTAHSTGSTIDLNSSASGTYTITGGGSGYFNRRMG